MKKDRRQPTAHYVGRRTRKTVWKKIWEWTDPIAVICGIAVAVATVIGILVGAHSNYSVVANSPASCGDCKHLAFPVVTWIFLSCGLLIAGMLTGAFVGSITKQGVHGEASWKFLAVIFGTAAFLYNFLAGAYFATTSVEVKAARDPHNKQSAIVTVKLERGDTWLEDIASVAYVLRTSHAVQAGETWQPVPMQCRQSGEHWDLRLSPKEKTESSFRIAVPEKGDPVVVVKVIHGAQWWPIYATSQASTLVSDFDEEKPLPKAER